MFLLYAFFVSFVSIFMYVLSYTVYMCVCVIHLVW